MLHAGYWVPLETVSDQVWIPGWFDGTRWVSGYWVEAAQRDRGYDQDWEEEEPSAPKVVPDAPLAVPVEPVE
jgi:hypothetical protein